MNVDANGVESAEEIKDEDFDDDILPDPDALLNAFNGGQSFSYNFNQSSPL